MRVKVGEVWEWMLGRRLPIPQGEPGHLPAQPGPSATTRDDSDRGAVVTDTQRYRVTSHRGGTGVEVLRKRDQHSVLMQGDDAASFWDALNDSRHYVDDDVVCERYDHVMHYDEASAARYRRDERRRAFKICQDAGVDTRAVRPEGWGER